MNDAQFGLAVATLLSSVSRWRSIGWECCKRTGAALAVAASLAIAACLFLTQ